MKINELEIKVKKWRKRAILYKINHLMNKIYMIKKNGIKLKYKITLSWN